MSEFQGFRQPTFRAGTTWHMVDPTTVEIAWLDGRRMIQFELEPDRVAPFQDFLALLGRGELPADRLASAFPGSADEYSQLTVALDELGMLAEGYVMAGEGMSGLSAYAALRQFADEIRMNLASPLVRAMIDGTVTRDQLIGYVIEYWHVTHLCPRALAPVLARDDLGTDLWDQLMDFYMIERNHDQMMENALAAVGIEREQLLRVQPLPATMAIMAALGLYAYNFPLALISTLFPMEGPELEFLELFKTRCADCGLPEEFVRPIVDHSEVNVEEAHDAVTLNMLSTIPFVGAEAVRECAKAVADVMEQRARLDAEIMAWYSAAGVRDFAAADYPVNAGRALSVAATQ